MGKLIIYHDFFYIGDKEVNKNSVDPPFLIKFDASLKRIFLPITFKLISCCLNPNPLFVLCLSTSFIFMNYQPRQLNAFYILGINTTKLVIRVSVSIHEPQKQDVTVVVVVVVVVVRKSPQHKNHDPSNPMETHQSRISPVAIGIVEEMSLEVKIYIHVAHKNDY